MDLEILDTQRGSNAGYELQLTHPRTGEKLAGFITVLGVDSEKYRELQRQQQRERIERVGRAQRLATTPEQIDAEALDLIVAATAGWREIQLGGADHPFTPDNARKLYQRFPWIREQVDRAVNDRGNFLPGSATS